jgi:DNA-binding MurR/RpiR family transcriptional regulator
LRAQTLTYRERIARLRSRAPSQTAPEAVFRAQVGQAIDELHRFQHALDERALTQAVDLIANATQVHLLAARRSFPVASYLAYALNQLEVRTHLLDGVGGMNREFAARIRPDEVLIAISFRNYTGEVVEIADSCSQRGIPVIAVTDSKLSPLVRASTLSFAIGDDGRAAFRSLVEPIVLAQSLVVAVGLHLAERSGRSRNTKARR